VRIAAAILAGGAASRLGGIAKGLLVDAENTLLIQRLIGELAIAGVKEVVLSVNDPQPYLQFGKPLIADLHPGSGPLGGIEAVLDHLNGCCDAVLFLPCDLPNLSANEIAVLIKAHESWPGRIVFIRNSDHDHALCAVIPVELLGVVSAAIQRGENGVGRLWRKCGAVAVPIDNSLSLLNLNTPADLHRWRKADGRPPGPTDLYK
jgi:molybdopterin-guanine dinucleotide biosynthesis protein A